MKFIITVLVVFFGVQFFAVEARPRNPLGPLVSCEASCHNRYGLNAVGQHLQGVYEACVDAAPANDPDIHFCWEIPSGIARTLCNICAAASLCADGLITESAECRVPPSQSADPITEFITRMERYLNQCLDNCEPDFPDDVAPQST